MLQKSSPRRVLRGGGVQTWAGKERSFLSEPAGPGERGTSWGLLPSRFEELRKRGHAGLQEGASERARVKSTLVVRAVGRAASPPELPRLREPPAPQSGLGGLGRAARPRQERGHQ